MELVGIVGSGATSVYAPIIVYEGKESLVKEENLVVIEDSKRGSKYLGVIRQLKRLDPFLNPWQRTTYVDKPELVNSGTFPHSVGYIHIIGMLSSEGELSQSLLPPNPGSKVLLIQSPSDIPELKLGEGLVIGKHKFSGIEIPISKESLRYHILVVGATGVGKSRLVTALIREVIKRTDWSVIVFDHSGMDYVPFFSKEHVVNSSDIVIDPIVVTELIFKLLGGGDKYSEAYILLATTLYMACMSSYGGKLEECSGIKELCSDSSEGSDLTKFLGNSLPSSRRKVMSRTVSLDKDSVIGLVSKLVRDELLEELAKSKLVWDKECYSRVLSVAVPLLGGKDLTQSKFQILLNLRVGNALFNYLSNRYLLAKDIVSRAFSSRLVIVDLSTEHTEVRRYVVTSVLQYLWELIDTNRRPVNTLVVIDEAHNYACRYCKPSIDAISRTAREGRKWGLGLVLATQRVIDIDTDVRNNINTVFFSKLQTAGDYENISSFMSLAGVREEYLSTLGRREFFLAGLGNPLGIPVLIKVSKVG